MPPRLVKGKAVLRRHLNVHPALTWCSCTECALNTFVTSNGEVQNGCYVTFKQQRAHVQRDKKRYLASKELADVPDLYPADPDELNSDEGTQRGSHDNSGDEATPEHSVPEYEVPATPESEEQGDAIIPGGHSSNSHPPRHRLSTLSHQLLNISKRLGVFYSKDFQAVLKQHPLVFATPPAASSSSASPNDLDSGNLYELDPVEKANYTFIEQELFLHDSLRFLVQNQTPKPGYSERITTLISGIEEELKQASRLKRDSWDQEQRTLKTEGKRIDSGRYLRGLGSMEPIACLIYLIAATAHFLGNLSLDDLSFFLPLLSLLVQIAMKDAPSFQSTAVLRSIPSDVRTVITSIQVDPVYNSLVCCPSCFQTYTFNRDDPESYPEFCTHRSTTYSRPCGRRLRIVKRGLEVPKREYIYQELPEWIARMYARPDIEEILDKYPKGFQVQQDNTTEGKSDQNNKPEGNSEGLDDIWDGSVLKNFLGPDGRHFMQPKPESEGRLIFGLNMDGFNPFGNKEAGKHVTTCGIYLVCFNLPPEIRYKSENIFLLGIVPGPQEPSTYEVNHVLRPLVNDLLSLWYTGIYLTKTTKYPWGRAIRCALVPIICDLPAARRVAGLGGHSAGNFCSECLLNLDDINELDQGKWKPRTYSEHCTHAEKWRDAATESQRTAIFQDYGAKWSELLRLPYWDPTLFVVIDSMHGFYLRLFHRHIRDVWGINAELEDGDGLPDLSLTETETMHAHHVLRSCGTDELRKLPKNVLQFLCNDAGLHYGGRKRALIKQLVEHRIAQNWPAMDRDVDQDTESQLSVPTILVENAYPLEIQNPNAVFPQSNTDPDPPSTTALAFPDVPDVSSPIRAGRNSAILDQDVLKLYESSQSDLLKAPKSKLVNLSIVKLGGQERDYERLSKKSLVEGLHSLRRQDGIIDDQGHKIKRNFPRETTSILAEAEDAEVPNSERENLDNLYRTGSKSAIARLRKSSLGILCVMKLQANQTRNYYQAKTKKALCELLDEKRLADGITDESGGLINEQSSKKDAVLGQETLEEIRKDMEEISLPSWYSPPPKHPGEVKWGKFKAVEWKSFCTVNLPITLTRLWGSSSKDSKRYLMLENFLHLVSAVKIADSRRITFEDIDLYEQHMKAYLSGFLKLYPFISLSPYQHLSLHFPAHLKRFGPTHSWRCFAFERYNGLLQQVPSNNKIGELEKSKFIRFCRTQNVRALFSEARLPSELKSVVELYESRYGHQGMGSVFEGEGIQTEPQKRKKGKDYPMLAQPYRDSFEKWMTSNHPEANCTFVPANHIPLSSIKSFGRRFVAGQGANSLVAFQAQNGAPGVGRLASLFSYKQIGKSGSSGKSGKLQDGERVEIFAVVQQLPSSTPNDKQHDMFRDLPMAVGHLVHNRTEDSRLVLVPFSRIISHVATIRVASRGDLLQAVPLV